MLIKSKNVAWTKIGVN